MPRYKEYDYRQSKILPVSFDRQILPGTFEESLSYLIDHELDLSVFDERYSNDETGRPAYDPSILLKVILLAYSRGITSSRQIAGLCEENVLFMAISADTRPHFTTIADFVSSCSDEIGSIFQQVVLICDELGLIGRDMFVIDGCKMPSNASKEWSGTREDLKKKRKKVNRAIKRILKQHRESDEKDLDDDIRRREKRQLKTLRKASRKIQEFLAETDEKIGSSGKPIQSNVTDNESAKMKTSHGVIQGYIGVAAVDSECQVVVHAEAHGQPQEHELLTPTVEGIREVLTPGRSKKDPLKGAKVIADSGYHSRKNVEYLEAAKVDGYIADTGFRSRDPRFQSAERHRVKGRVKLKRSFSVDDFHFDPKKRSVRCPAGNLMWLKCSRARIGRYLFLQFQAHKADCEGCGLRRNCLRTETQKTPRLVNIRVDKTGTSLLDQMRSKIDSVRGRHIYSHRISVVEPVFGNITSAIGIKRFSLRGKKKVNGQWKLMAMIHNIIKIHRYGWSLA